MSKSPRVHTAEFQARVALVACKGDRTLGEIAAQHQVHVKLVQGREKQMLDGAATVFSETDRPVSSKEAEAKQAELCEHIGRLKMEREWLKKKSAAFL